MTKSDTILVTGGTGFVGSYVVRDLVQKGYRVKALQHSRNLPTYIDNAVLNKAEWIEGDILDTVFLEELMRDTPVVIHAAACVSFAARDQDKMYAVNIEGTTNVVNTAISTGVQRLVHVSSVASFGRNRNIVVNEKKVFEESKLNTHYSISKFRGEMEVWRGIGEGLNGVIVNPSTILGFGDWNTTSNVLFKNSWNGFPWFSNGVNGFVDVSDVSRAIVLLMESDISAERFIVSAENWSFKQLLDALADGFGKKRPYLQANSFLAGLAWRAEKIRTAITGKNSLITKESARVSRTHTEYDHSKLLQALPGFSFTSLADTIRQTCAKYASGLPV